MDVASVVVIGEDFAVTDDMTDEQVSDIVSAKRFVAIKDDAAHDEQVCINMREQRMYLSHEDAFALALFMSSYTLHSPYADDIKPYFDEVKAQITAPKDKRRVN
jgi:hypothetical protein